MSLPLFSFSFFAVIPLTRHSKKTKLWSQGYLSTPLMEGVGLVQSWHQQDLGSSRKRPILAHLQPPAWGWREALCASLTAKLVPGLWTVLFSPLGECSRKVAAAPCRMGITRMFTPPRLCPIMKAGVDQVLIIGQAPKAMFYDNFAIYPLPQFYLDTPFSSFYRWGN